MTQKAKMYKYLSRRKRYDMDPPALGEMAPTAMPRPPPEATKMPVPKKALNTFGTEGRTKARRHAEDAGWSTWTVYPERGDSAQDGQRDNGASRPTLTSSARAVLSLSRRYAAESLLAEQSFGGNAHGSSMSGSKPSAHGGGKISKHQTLQDPTQAWSPARQSRGLPRPVKEWVCKGLEFTDAGLGIGDRFDTNLKKLAERAPGAIYDTDFGNVGRWKSEASIPTKQPVGKYGSTETHKMGARRDVSAKRDRQRPGPGTYELLGFAQELTHKLNKRPKGEAPRTLSPSGSTKGSQVFQAS